MFPVAGMALLFRHNFIIGIKDAHDLKKTAGVGRKVVIAPGPRTMDLVQRSDLPVAVEINLQFL